MAHPNQGKQKWKNCSSGRAEQPWAASCPQDLCPHQDCPTSATSAICLCPTWGQISGMRQDGNVPYAQHCTDRSSPVMAEWNDRFFFPLEYRDVKVKDKKGGIFAVIHSIFPSGIPTLCFSFARVTNTAIGSCIRKWHWPRLGLCLLEHSGGSGTGRDMGSSGDRVTGRQAVVRPWCWVLEAATQAAAVQSQAASVQAGSHLLATSSSTAPFPSCLIPSQCMTDSQERPNCEAQGPGWVSEEFFVMSLVYQGSLPQHERDYKRMCICIWKEMTPSR